jgi:hypothetical protein
MKPGSARRPHSTGKELQTNRRREEAQLTPERKLLFIQCLAPKSAGWRIKDTIQKDFKNVKVGDFIMYEPQDVRGFAQIGKVVSIENSSIPLEEKPFFIVQVLKKQMRCLFSLTHVQRRVSIETEYSALLILFEHDMAPPFPTWLFRGINSEVFI